MKKAFSLLVVLVYSLSMSFASVGLAQTPEREPETQSAQASLAGKAIYLPLVHNGTDLPPTSIALIDQDIIDGKISAEQGLIYKVYAVWGSPSLPKEYAGSGPGNSGDEVMREVAEFPAPLSDATKLALTPFFLLPNDPHSYFSQTHASPQSLHAASWQSVTAAGGKVKVWYWDAEADGARQAAVVKAAIDGKIWQKFTELMQSEPKYGAGTLSVLNIYLYNGYFDLKDAWVPFDGDWGVTLKPKCADTPSWIYINNLKPDGDEKTPGMIQATAHEMFHSFQSFYPVAYCPSYRWLREATATWAEDYVYPLANSERDGVDRYLSHADIRLDAFGNMHQYGAYLYPYLLTHYIDTTSAVIRKMWVNAKNYENSYLAIDNAIQAEYRSEYWTAFMAALWNTGEFQKFYQTNDKFYQTVSPGNAPPVDITVPLGEVDYQLKGDLPTGAIRYYHLKFDSSVRSFTILNGIKKKLSLVPAGIWTYFSTDMDPADQTYDFSDLSDADAKGANLLLLMRAARETDYMIMPLSDRESYSHCFDAQGPITDFVIAQSNSDWEHPDRIMKPADLPTTIIANNVPCYKMNGNAKVTKKSDGVTEITTSSFTFVCGGMEGIGIPGENYFDATQCVFPETHMIQTSSSVSWSISGTNSDGCVYANDGDNSFNSPPDTGNGDLIFITGVPKDSPSYRGYYADGGFYDPMPHLKFTATCPKYGTSHSYYIFEFGYLSAPLREYPDLFKIGPAGGGISASYTESIWKYEFSFTPVTR